MVMHAGNASYIKTRLCYHQTLLSLFYTLNLAQSHCSSFVQYSCSGLVKCSWCEGEASSKLPLVPLPELYKEPDKACLSPYPTLLVIAGGCLGKVCGKEDEKRAKPHSIHSLASGNA